MRGPDWTSGKSCHWRKTSHWKYKMCCWCSGNGNDPLSAIASRMQRDAWRWPVGLMFSKTSFFVCISKSSRSTVWQRHSVSTPFPCFSDSSAPCRGRLYQHFEKGQWEQVGRTGTILDAKAWPLFANMVQITSLHHTSSIPFIQLPSISISYSVLQIKIQAVEAWKEMDQSDQSLKSS